MIEISRDLFETAAEEAGFEGDEDGELIRTGYNGRGYARNCTALVGAEDSLLKFFAELGAASKNTEEWEESVDMSTVRRLAVSMGRDSMGRSNEIFYWSENVLKLTEG
jgi:hypothetical protein